MTSPCPDAFPVTGVEDFASYLGLDGTDADMLYEMMYDIEGWEWEDEMDKVEWKGSA